MDHFSEITFNYVTFLFLNPVNVAKLGSVGYEKHYLFQFIMLNFIYVFFSIILSLYTFFENKSNRLNIAILLQFVSTVVPTLITIYLSIDILSEKKKNLNSKISNWLDCKVNQKVNRLKLLARLAVLLATRAIKLYHSPKFVNAAYSLCSMMPELCYSMSDFTFIFYVENLTSEIKAFNDKLLLLKEINCEKVIEIKITLEKLHEISRNINEAFSSRLIVTLFYNFVQLVVSFYWIFIRIAFGHFNGFVTFLYVIQPFMCIYGICKSTQRCLNAVFNKPSFIVCTKI